jgi:hypothetical protein
MIWYITPIVINYNLKCRQFYVVPILENYNYICRILTNYYYCITFEFYCTRNSTTLTFWLNKISYLAIFNIFYNLLNFCQVKHIMFFIIIIIIFNISIVTLYWGTYNQSINNYNLNRFIQNITILNNIILILERWYKCTLQNYTYIH